MGRPKVPAAAASTCTMPDASYLPLRRNSLLRYLYVFRNADSLGLRDLHEAFLNKLGCSRHSVGVDFYSGYCICISPAVHPCCCTAEFNLHTLIHKISDKFFVWIAGRNIAISVVRRVM